MCMISAVVTKEFGVIAADSAQYDLVKGDMQFNVPKLSFINGKYLTTFIGDKIYFSKLDYSKFNNDLASLSLYLEQYLLEMRPNVEQALKELEVKKEDRKPNVCLFVMGVYNNKPTLVQFNSFLDFKPKYLFSENGPKFSTIYYGDNEKKKQIFSSSTAYMVKKADKWKSKFSPGIAAEILTRGIYKKADAEEKEFGTKYAGGSVATASVLATGECYGLSNVRV